MVLLHSPAFAGSQALLKSHLKKVWPSHREFLFGACFLCPVIQHVLKHAGTGTSFQYDNDDINIYIYPP